MVPRKNPSCCWVAASSLACQRWFDRLGDEGLQTGQCRGRVLSGLRGSRYSHDGTVIQRREVDRERRLPPPSFSAPAQSREISTRNGAYGCTARLRSGVGETGHGLGVAECET